MIPSNFEAVYSLGRVAGSAATPYSPGKSSFWKCQNREELIYSTEEERPRSPEPSQETVFNNEGERERGRTCVRHRIKRTRNLSYTTNPDAEIRGGGQVGANPITQPGTRAGKSRAWHQPLCSGLPPRLGRQKGLQAEPWHPGPVLLNRWHCKSEIFHRRKTNGNQPRRLGPGMRSEINRGLASLWGRSFLLLLNITLLKSSPIGTPSNWIGS